VYCGNWPCAAKPELNETVLSSYLGVTILTIFTFNNYNVVVNDLNLDLYVAAYIYIYINKINQK
jgi:hypothetical protein